MGGELFERFADWTRIADEVLGYSIRELCLEDPDDRLGLTAYTQPALFVVNALTYRARIEDGGPAPAFLAGHSLGEYNALLASGVFGFASGLRLVARRGELMGKVTGGGMAAVIGLEPSRIEQVLAENDAGRRLDVANFNSVDQTVIAGPLDDLEAVRDAITGAGARSFILLKVSAPFHSRYMRAAAQEFAAVIQSEATGFETPTVPVVSNVTARLYVADAIVETLGQQIDHAVRWLDSVRFLLDNGVNEFEEIGPGSVLSKLVTRIRRATRPA
jgi:malonyl CoA-acyl carrier protein transacylase